MKIRNEQIDYLKSIFIILMILFHLVYIGDKYNYLKNIIYTFHMSGFFIISGYLFDAKKRICSFLHMIAWIFIPYVIMETGYVVMASILPIREHIAELTPLVIIEKIFIAPIGPYWYLHTLILCYIVCYILGKLTICNNRGRLIFMSLCFLGLSYLGLLSFDNVIYFMFGIIIKNSGTILTAIFQPCRLSLFPLILLCCFPDNLNRGTLAGIAITYLSISFLLSLYPFLSPKLKMISGCIGRNTLILLLFSPIFTLLSKKFVPVFLFDATGILFACTAVVFAIGGSFGIAWIMDRLNLTRFFLGKKNVLNQYY